ncbi:MAG: aldehyde dehydrogenase [Thermomicrobium sp.]|nr:aldehyde dehydrogenase [Thermomicrobium sp.]
MTTPCSVRAPSAALPRPNELQLQTAHSIGGAWISSARTFTVHSPIDWPHPLAEVPRGDAATVDRAVQAAQQAFPAWASLSPEERAVYLERLACLIEANAERIASIECLDVGMLYRSLRERLVFRAARNYRFAARVACEYGEPTWTTDGLRTRVTAMPAGPAAIIIPWNAPFMLATWKTAAALAAGCTVVLKPPEWAPLSCCLLAELVEQAAFPPGVFNVVHGIGEEVGAALVRHPGIRRISFTGSTETGRRIGAQAGANLVPYTAELGGKSPFVVFADADLEAAARMAAMQYDDAGQICFAGTRLLVDESVAEPFLERFVAAVARHVLGDPREPETTIAPLIHPEHLARVEGFVERARRDGARVLVGGRRATEVGRLWYVPTLIMPRHNDQEIVQREVFGPVLTLQLFRSEAEAIQLANSTAYGLAAVVYTESAVRADRVARSLRAGTVWINTWAARDLAAPFGGIGDSGLGREGGRWGLEFYSDLKAIQQREEGAK